MSKKVVPYIHGGSSLYITFDADGKCKYRVEDGAGKAQQYVLHDEDGHEFVLCVNPRVAEPTARCAKHLDGWFTFFDEVLAKDKPDIEAHKAAVWFTIRRRFQVFLEARPTPGFPRNIFYHPSRETLALAERLNHE